jgi:hypothetical protein
MSQETVSLACTATQFRPTKYRLQDDMSMPTDPVVDENVLGRTMAKVQESIKQAFMGYFSVNLFDLPSGFKFGVFNDCQAKSVQITKLLESFRTEGLLHCDCQTAILVGLRRDWISSNPIMEPKEGDIGSVESIAFTLMDRKRSTTNKSSSSEETIVVLRLRSTSTASLRVVKNLTNNSRNYRRLNSRMRCR